MYHICSLSIGAIQFCAGMYTGSVVQESDTPDKYVTCQVVAGSVQFCGSGFTGEAVLPDPDQKYHVCSVSAGHIDSCMSTGYTGMTPVNK